MKQTFKFCFGTLFLYDLTCYFIDLSHELTWLSWLIPGTWLAWFSPQWLAWDLKVMTWVLLVICTWVTYSHLCFLAKLSLFFLRRQSAAYSISICLLVHIILVADQCRGSPWWSHLAGSHTSATARSVCSGEWAEPLKLPFSFCSKKPGRSAERLSPLPLNLQIKVETSPVPQHSSILSHKHSLSLNF